MPSSRRSLPSPSSMISILINLSTNKRQETKNKVTKLLEHYLKTSMHLSQRHEPIILAHYQNPSSKRKELFAVEGNRLHQPAVTAHFQLEANHTRPDPTETCLQVQPPNKKPRDLRTTWNGQPTITAGSFECKSKLARPVAAGNQARTCKMHFLGRSSVAALLLQNNP